MKHWPINLDFHLEGQEIEVNKHLSKLSSTILTQNSEKEKKREIWNPKHEEKKSLQKCNSGDWTDSL